MRHKMHTATYIIIAAFVYLTLCYPLYALALVVILYCLNFFKNDYEYYDAIQNLHAKGIPANNQMI